MKKFITYFFVALFGAMTLSGPLQADSYDKELQAFKTAIKEKYDLKVKAFAKNDADTIADKFYSKDVVSVDMEGKITIGREALRKEYEEIVPTATVAIESVYTFVGGDAGWDWANFHVTPTNPDEKPFTFIILFLWAKENGQWICKGDQYVVGSFENL